MRLANKVAIVTGSSRGLGKHIAKLFAREGAITIVTGRSQESGEIPGSVLETASEIEQAGGQALPVVCDLGVESEIQRLVSTVMARYGQIDLIVNNAVIRVPTKLIDSSPAEMEWVLRVNVLGPFNVCKYALPEMMKRRQGHIINIKSSEENWILKPVRDWEPGNAPYLVSKAALTMFSLVLAAEVKEHGIAVNAYYPGHLSSDAHTAMRLQRSKLYGTPKQVPHDSAEVCDESLTYLAMQTAATLTGRIVRRVEYGSTWGPGIDLPR